MEKKTVGILFGGQSSEHEVSCMSAATIIASIDTGRYDIVIIGITKEGKWIKTECVEDIESGAWKNGKTRVVISPDAAHGGLIFTDGNEKKIQKIDVVFPVLHGLYGEDGTIQGVLELARIPYVGCGVLSSALAMDKLFTKIVVERLGIRQAAFAALTRSSLKDMKAAVKQVEDRLTYPVFVKPSNAGSSRGVTKATGPAELEAALLEAAKHDRKILVEETIIGREIECAVLGGEDSKASGVGEVLAAADFYDYDAKYNSVESKTVISPELPSGKEDEIREDALAIFHALDGYGLARVDFFLEAGTNEVVFNEINTMPGFTNISMYPMLWEAKGISKQMLVDRLIKSALLRNAE